MNAETFFKINELAKQLALTNEQLQEYLLLNGIDLYNDMDVDFSDKNFIKLIDNLKAKNKYNHDNKSGLQFIRIEGLFNKYDYNLEFDKDIVIWISENGKGKTTILTIIVALLTADARILYEINFKRIIVFISNKEFIIDKEKIRKSFPKNNNRMQSKILYLLRELQEFIPLRTIIKLRYDISNNGIIDLSILDDARHRISSDKLIDLEKLDAKIYEIKDLQYGEFYDVLYKIKEELKEEVVFYPTYRRIEVGMEKVLSSRIGKISSSDLTTKYMDFGMRDVKKRISQLLTKMREDANSSYIELNANIISELLEDKISNYINNFGNIDMHKVDVVIKRIGEERIANIKKLKDFIQFKHKHRKNSNVEFLIYYLQKLVNIYNSQAAINEKLTKFVQVCSKYLVAKKIVYNEALLTVDVFDNDGIKIDLDSLSSGEKQIVSIFSKVYLDVTMPCIFIIDEPEISLSIEWQKNFLKDIYNSDKINLLIATTHSPFVFKNDYIDYVKELGTTKEFGDVTKR